MNKPAQYSYLLEIFSSSIEILEKNKIQASYFKTHLKKIKFKILHNIDEYSTKRLDTSLRSYREILKILYLTNFEDNLDQNALNRINCNKLHLLTNNINKYTYNIWCDNPTFRDIYNQTFSISILYKMYKIQKRK